MPLFGRLSAAGPITGDACTRALLRDDMKAMGLDDSKNFSRRLSGLESHGMVIVNDEEITIISYRKSKG